MPGGQDHTEKIRVGAALSLSGRFSHERCANLPPDDWRRYDASFNEPELGANLLLVERLEGIATRVGCTLPELAIAWTLAWRGVDGAIVGARRPEQVDGWIRAADVQLGADALADIAAAIKATGAGSGPLSPTRTAAD